LHVDPFSVEQESFLHHQDPHPMDRGAAGHDSHNLATPLYGPAFTADPYAVYELLRVRFGPFAPVQVTPGEPATLVLGYREALQISGDPARFPPNPRADDGPRQDQLREVLNEGLDHINLIALASVVADAADRVIDTIARQGQADLLSDYCVPLLLRVSTRVLGCSDRMTDRLIHSLTRAEVAHDCALAAVLTFVKLKRKAPGQDIASWMAAYEPSLTDEELARQCLRLIEATAQPCANLIANALRSILTDERFADDLRDRMVSVDDALQEALWNDPPMASIAIVYPTEDEMFDGYLLPAGQPVVISAAAANRDPRVRKSLLHVRDNRAYLSYGVGVHSCPAREQAQTIALVAITRLLDRLPDMRLAVPAQQLTWRPSPRFRSLNDLPVSFPRTSAPTDQPGDASWTTSFPPLLKHPRLAPSVASSTQRHPRSPSRSRSRWWNFLVEFRRGK
jgi:cytochrome P450